MTLTSSSLTSSRAGKGVKVWMNVNWCHLLGGFWQYFVNILSAHDFEAAISVQISSIDIFAKVQQITYTICCAFK